MARLTIPRDANFGQGTIAELKSLKGTKAVFVIGGGTIKRNGTLDKIEGYLKDAGIFRFCSYNNELPI